jgi:hypothetical protein
MSEPTKDTALSRIYREGAWPEPSRQIDQAILAASRRAAREQHSFARRWAPSFAVAATVVLTSTLVLKVYREQPDAVSPSVPEKMPAARAKEPLAAADSKSAQTTPAPAVAAAAPSTKTPKGFSSTMDTAEAERLDRMQRDFGLKQAVPASESPLAAPAQKSAPAAKAASVLKKETPDAERARVLPSESATPSAPVSVFGAPPPAPTPQSSRAVAKPASPFTQSAPVSARPEPAQPQSVEGARIQAPAPVKPAQPATASEASPVASSIAAPRSTVRGALANEAKPAERSPQKWIEDIRKLMAEGKFEDVGGELAQFRKRYPDYPLPEDLR